jgi:hypothetical protein
MPYKVGGSWRTSESSLVLESQKWLEVILGDLPAWFPHKLTFGRESGVIVRNYKQYPGCQLHMSPSGRTVNSPYLQIVGQTLR